jgi:hypothetical protein
MNKNEVMSILAQVPDNKVRDASTRRINDMFSVLNECDTIDQYPRIVMAARDAIRTKIDNIAIDLLRQFKMVNTHDL